MMGYGNSINLKNIFHNNIPEMVGAGSPVGNIANFVDENPTTKTSECTAEVNGTLIAFRWDLGSVKTLLVSSNFNIWTSTGTIYANLEYGVAGYTEELVQVASTTGTTSQSKTTSTYQIRARYVQLRIFTSTTADGHFEGKEIIGNVVK
jgi:hypothetical protein